MAFCVRPQFVLFYLFIGGIIIFCDSKESAYSKQGVSQSSRNKMISMRINPIHQDSQYLFFNKSLDSLNAAREMADRLCSLKLFGKASSVAAIVSQQGMTRFTKLNFPDLLLDKAVELEEHLHDLLWYASAESVSVLYGLADTMKNAGFKDEAKAVLKKAIAAKEVLFRDNPYNLKMFGYDADSIKKAINCLDTRLASVKDSYQWRSIHWLIDHAFGWILADIPQLVGAFVFLFILFLLVLLFLQVRKWGYIIESIDASGCGETGFSKPIEAIIRDQINHLETGCKGLIDVSSGGQAGADQLLSLVPIPIIKWLPSFMRIFNFSGFRRAKLSCCLLPSSPKGVGIAMVLKFGLRGKSITQTCWESDFTPQFPVELKDPKNLYYFLCIPVSAFLVSRINKLRSRSAFRKWWRTYGTEDWESCALCQIGAALFLRNNFEPAKHAYRLALSKDARNHQAWYNLGTCFVRLWSEEGKALAEECFNKTIN